jgi:hypothetical protein
MFEVKMKFLNIENFIQDSLKKKTWSHHKKNTKMKRDQNSKKIEIKNQEFDF